MKLVNFLPSKKGRFFKDSAVDLTTNLVAYWDFDTSFNEYIANQSPIANTANRVNSGGILDGYTNFPSNHYVDYLHQSRYNLCDANSDIPFSFSFWVYCTSMSQIGNWIINKRQNSSSLNEWQVLIQADKSVGLSKLTTNASSYISVVSQANVISLNNWHHVVLTDNKTTNDVSSAKIYIDSISIPCTLSSVGTYTKMSPLNGSIRFGNAGWGANGILSHRGNIDEMAIWKDRVLTQEEVNVLYNSGNPVKLMNYL